MNKRGFTLMEMLIVLGIIVVIFTVLLTSNKKYSEKLNLKNQTYNALLMLRQAQVYSLGVKAGGTPATFNASYGVSFNMSSPGQFVFFTDENNNGKYEGPGCQGECGDNEQASVYPLLNNVTIQKVCGIYNNSEQCSPQSSLQNVDITFKRPRSEASIKFIKTDGSFDLTLLPPATVYFISQTGLISSIKVDATGGVSIQ